MTDPQFEQLKSEAEQLKALRTQKPIPARVRLVQDALNSKWEGTRSLAVQTLAEWGKPEFKELLKPILLDELASSSDYRSYIRVLSDSLARLVEPSDSEWVADLLSKNEKHLWDLRALSTKLKLFAPK